MACLFSIMTSSKRSASSGYLRSISVRSIFSSTNSLPRREVEKKTRLFSSFIIFSSSLFRMLISRRSCTEILLLSICLRYHKKREALRYNNCKIKRVRLNVQKLRMRSSVKSVMISDSRVDTVIITSSTTMMPIGTVL